MNDFSTVWGMQTGARRGILRVVEGFVTATSGARASRGWLLILAAVAVSLSMLVVGTRGDAATAYDAEETQFLKLINDYRQQNGLRPLIFSDTLTVAAEHHSKDMAEYGFFAHNTQQSSYYPDGAKPWDRMEAEGYDYNTARGENLAVGYETAEEAMEAWRESPSHNAAMLDESYRVMGVSRLNVPGSVHGWYWTTDFGGEVDPSSRPANEPPGPVDRPKKAPDDSGAIENGSFRSTGGWTQRARDGADLVVEDEHARLGGYFDGRDDLRQKVRITENARLSYNVRIRAGMKDRDDGLVVRLTDDEGEQVAVLDRFTGEDRTGWSRERANLSRFAGQAVFLSFHAETDARRATTFYVDDLSLGR